jgi:hypothetical protein
VRKYESGSTFGGRVIPTDRLDGAEGFDELFGGNGLDKLLNGELDQQ